MSVRSRSIDVLARLFVRVLELLGNRLPDPSLNLQIGLVSDKHPPTGGSPPMNLVLDNEQKQRVRLNPKTRGGAPAPIDGIPTWVSSDESVATVEVAEDGKSAYVMSGAPGTATVTATADADMDGTEFREVSEVINVAVFQAEANSLGAEADEPELK